MNYEKIVNSKAYAIIDKILNLMLINMLWFIVSFLGLGIFTFYPATLVVFMLVSLIIENKTVPIFKAYFKLFAKFYWKAQKVFFIFLIIGFILFFNVRVYYFQLSENFSYISFIGFVTTLLIILLTALAFIQSFFVMMYFPDYKTFKTIKYSYMFGIAFTFSSLLVLIVFLISVFIMIFVPYLLILIFFILTSLLTFISIKIVKNKYSKILPKKDQLNIMDII